MIRRLRAALAFLTALPLPGPIDGHDMALGLPLFPVVGLLVGGISGLVGWGVVPRLGPFAGALAALLTQLLLTRGLHWDGLLDTIDGLQAHPQEKSLAAMRDPRVGGGAVVGGGAFLLLFVALCARIPWRELPLALASAGLAGRAAVAIAVTRFPYARLQGLGAAFAAKGRLGLLGAAVALIALSLAAQGRGAAVAGLATAVALLGGRFAVRRFGGCTGDVYGAMEVLSEVLCLAAFAWR